MTSLRQLRAEASRALKAARSSCALATREARLVAKAGCESLKAHELRLAAKHCDDVARSAELARAAYQRARPPETPARKAAKARAAERREQTERDAVQRVMAEAGVPELVATYAVRAAIRRGAGKGVEPARRWERAAEWALEGDYVSRAWQRVERETGQRRPRPSPPKREQARKKLSPAQRARRRRRPQRAPDVVILLDDAPF